MHEQLTKDPRRAVDSGRHHRLKGGLGSGKHGGRDLERWQYEVTGSGRVWFLVDDDQRKVRLTLVESGHPSRTDE